MKHFQFKGVNRGGEYHVAEMIGKGFSCVVYLADFMDREGNVTEHILKEYNPALLHMIRSFDSMFRDEILYQFLRRLRVST